jgi:hypothetical protein
LQDQPKKIKGDIQQMKTSTFISALRVAPNDQLIFVDLKGHAVGRGYHLTD